MKRVKIRKESIWIAVTLVILLSFSGFSYALLREEDSTSAQKEKVPEYAPGEVLVKFKEGTSSEAGLSSVNAAFAGGKQERLYPIAPAINKFKKDYTLEKDKDGWYWFRGKSYKETSDMPDEELFEEAYAQMPPEERALYRTYKVTLPEGVSVEEAVESLSEDPNVEFAELNYIYEVQIVPRNKGSSLDFELDNVSMRLIIKDHGKTIKNRVPRSMVSCLKSRKAT